MKKNFYLIVGIFALANVIGSFISNKETDQFLWIEMNIRYYRLIWALAAFFILANYVVLRKAEKKPDQ